MLSTPPRRWMPPHLTSGPHDLGRHDVPDRSPALAPECSLTGGSDVAGRESRGGARDPGDRFRGIRGGVRGLGGPRPRASPESPHPIVEVDLGVALLYSRISRGLRVSGEAIGSNDTWIAATALAHEVPLLSRNAEHFERVPGLEVIAYG